MLKIARLALFCTTSILGFNTAAAGGPELVPTLSTSSFNQIDAAGDVNVIIHGAQHSGIAVISNAKAPVKAQVVHHTLYINAPWIPGPGGLKQRSTVVANVPNLTSLVVNGPANVGGANIHSRGLTISSYGSGKIKLIGEMKVNQINQAGNNRIYLRWVNSTTLSINSKNAGFIYLGGVANVIYARLYDHAILNAQYLRTHIVQVQTKNHAAAFVYPVTTLRAFATNDANIYYYKYPQNLTRDTSQSGNVLQMAWRP